MAHAECPWEEHRQQSLVCTFQEAPEPPHQWTVSHHVEAPSNYLHKQHTLGVALAGIRTLLEPCSLGWAPEILSFHSCCSQTMKLFSLGCKFLLFMYKYQSRFYYKRGMYTAHNEDTLGMPSLGKLGGYAIGPYRRVHSYEATLPSPRYIATLPNT